MAMIICCSQSNFRKETSPIIKTNFCMKSFVFLVLAFLCTHSSFGQQFSILTCESGDEVYSTFGHSAIRYTDTAQGIDWVYNYGLFEFSDPNFIPKFCMGKLDYMVGKETMNDFMAQYIYQQRTVFENPLNLMEDQRDSLLRFLEWNLLPANKYYRYDFLFNNCATKIIEVLEKNCDGIQLNFPENTSKESFRDLIHRYARNSVPWIDWGMDLGIGSRTDRVITSRELCFLPYYVSKAIESGKNTKNQKDLSESSTILVEFAPHSSSLSFFSSPMFFGLIVLLISLLHLRKNRTWSRIFMGVFFILLGIGGFVVGFEWFFTEHSVTKNNWNLGWLNPFFLIYGFYLIRMKETRWLNILLVLGLITSLVGWLFGIQDFHIASILLIIASLFHLGVYLKYMLKR
jgi:hypothetical protein